MKKVNVLLCVLLQPLWLCAQSLLPLSSPSEILSADVRVNNQFVQIDLLSRGEKVIEAKTLQLEFEKDLEIGNWE
ncbi:MAG: hypothetical protein ACK5L5_12960, partial [Bacteroidales bacterium]